MWRFGGDIGAVLVIQFGMFVQKSHRFIDRMFRKAYSRFGLNMIFKDGCKVKGGFDELIGIVELPFTNMSDVILGRRLLQQGRPGRGIPSLIELGIPNARGVVSGHVLTRKVRGSTHPTHAGGHVGIDKVNTICGECI